MTLFDAQAAPPLNNGVAVWLLPAPVPSAPCSGGGGCFNLSLRLSEATASTGQRVGGWAVAGCLVAGGACTDAEWVPLTGELPAAAATAIGARRFLQLSLRAPAPAALSALRFTVETAYKWGGLGGGAPGAAPLVLSTAALYDWRNASACVPAGCHLASW